MISPQELEERLDLLCRETDFLVRARETKTLEFKSELSVATFKKSLKTMAAFASQEGGRIIFGVRDRPRILCGIGDQDVDEGLQSGIISSSLMPAPDSEFAKFEITGKTIAVLEIAPLRKKPCMAAKDISNTAGEEPILKQGMVYARRRGQTSPMSSNEFLQILSDRDDAIKSEILSFISRGSNVGFDRAIVADASRVKDGADSITYFLPIDAAKDLHVVDRAKLVLDNGAPAYEIQGNIELTVPSESDPRLPMLPTHSADELRQAVRTATLPDLPFGPIHLRKAAEHLGFWQNSLGNLRNTGFEPLSKRPIYYRESRDAIVRFAIDNPSEFLEVSASRKNFEKFSNS